VVGLRGSVPAAGRVVGLDVARYVALVGMIATHSLSSVGSDGGTTVVQQVAGGRASALFAVLAGVSLALMSGRTTPLRGRELGAVSAGLAVRALLVTLLGLALGFLPAGVLVILPYYGVLFLLGLPFLGLRARSLVVLAAGWVVVVPVLAHALRMQLPATPIASPTLESLRDPGALLSQLTLTGSYPALPWLGYVLAGMALGRLDLRRRRTAYDLVVVGACLAAVSWSVSALLVGRPEVRERLRETLPPWYGDLTDALAHGLYGTTPTGSWWWLVVEAPHTGTPFDLAHTTGTALLVIGLALLVARPLPRLTRVLFGAGAMTLTLYSLHLVLRTPAFLPEDDPRTFGLHVAVVTAVGAVFALAGRRGPLETVVTGAARRTAAVLRG
jgi:uncharacterized membrane protein